MFVDVFEVVEVFLDVLCCELWVNFELMYCLVKVLLMDVYFFGKDVVKFVNLIELIGDYLVDVVLVWLDGFLFVELKKMV